LTSSYEGLSHTLLEASSRGLAIIASNCGGNGEVIQSETNGLLVPYGDVAALQTALRRLEGDEDFGYPLPSSAPERRRAVFFRSDSRRDHGDSQGETGRMNAVTHIMGFQESSSAGTFSGAERHLFTLMAAQKHAGLTVELMPLIFRDGPILQAKLSELQHDNI